MQTGTDDLRKRFDYVGCCEPQFYAPNESIAKVAAALRPDEDSNILAICGSGCVAFDLLGSGARITAVDFEAAQLDYAKMRASALLDRKVRRFLNPLSLLQVPDNLAASAEHFLYRTNLCRIRANLDRLQFEYNDIFLGARRGFTHVYLSNASSWLTTGEHGSNGRRMLRSAIDRLTRHLEPPGLVFSSVPLSGASSFGPLTFLEKESAQVNELDSRWENSCLYQVSRFR